jgi:ribonuclease HI
MASSGKYYVVWEGRETGIFESWAACEKAIKGFEGAKYKSFKTREMAEKAFAGNLYKYWGKTVHETRLSPEELKAKGRPLENAIAVDAACNGRTGEMEYQGVFVGVKQQIFHQGPFDGGTNNIGEFLAIVHALAWCQKHRVDLPVYTDSKTAMAWVRNKKARTKATQTSKNQKLFELIDRAEQWLEANTWKNPILKWETEAWGEIPADFGRK